jgi:hypothetical protein
MPVFFLITGIFPWISSGHHTKDLSLEFISFALAIFSFFFHTRGYWMIESDGEKIIAKNGKRKYEIKFSQIESIVARPSRHKMFSRRITIFFREHSNDVLALRTLARNDGMEERHLLDPYLAQGGKITQSLF